MRTLTLFAALLLLALQAQAQRLQETADQLPTQDQPEAKDQGELWAEDQDQAEDSDQDVAISFTGEERFTRALGGRKEARCTCIHRKLCNFPRKKYGLCWVRGRIRNLCCD